MGRANARLERHIRPLGRPCLELSPQGRTSQRPPLATKAFLAGGCFSVSGSTHFKRNHVTQEATMTKKPGSHHVVPNADGGWDVKKDGATRSSGHFDRKQDAVDVGRKINQNQGKDGKIQNKRQSRQRPVSAGGEMSSPVRFQVLWNRAGVRKPDWELLRLKAKYPILQQTRHPRPVPGNQEKIVSLLCLAGSDCVRTSSFIIKVLRDARALRLFCGRSSFPPPKKNRALRCLFCVLSCIYAHINTRDRASLCRELLLEDEKSAPKKSCMA